MLVPHINSIAGARFTLGHFAEGQVNYDFVLKRNQGYFEDTMTDEGENELNCHSSVMIKRKERKDRGKER